MQNKMNIVLIILSLVFIFSIIMLIKSIHIISILNNNIKEHFGDGALEFFYTKDCSLCPLAKQKLLKRLDKNTSFIERNLTRIKKKRQIQRNGKTEEEEYEDYENESDGKRAESFGIHWKNVPVTVIQASSVITIMYLNSSTIDRL